MAGSALLATSQPTTQGPISTPRANNEVNPGKRILLEELTVPQLAKKFHTFY
jgi:hypothetical protein